MPLMNEDTSTRFLLVWTAGSLCRYIWMLVLSQFWVKPIQSVTTISNAYIPILWKRTFQTLFSLSAKNRHKLEFIELLPDCSVQEGHTHKIPRTEIPGFSNITFWRYSNHNYLSLVQNKRHLKKTTDELTK